MENTNNANKNIKYAKLNTKYTKAIFDADLLNFWRTFFRPKNVVAYKNDKYEIWVEVIL